MNDITDELVNLFIKYDYVINALAYNVYHNTDENNIEIIRIDIRLKYWNLLLANKITLAGIKSELALFEMPEQRWWK